MLSWVFIGLKNKPEYKLSKQSNIDLNTGRTYKKRSFTEIIYFFQLKEKYLDIDIFNMEGLNIKEFISNLTEEDKSLLEELIISKEVLIDPFSKYEFVDKALISSFDPMAVPSDKVWLNNDKV